MPLSGPELCLASCLEPFGLDAAMLLPENTLGGSHPQIPKAVTNGLSPLMARENGPFGSVKSMKL